MKHRRLIQLTLLTLIACCGLLPACDADDDDSPGDAQPDDDDDSGDDDDSTYDPYAAFSPAGKPIGEMLGISSHMSRGVVPSPKRDMEIEALVKAGIKMVRTDFKWHTMEPENDVWYFDGYDMMVGLCLDAGLSMTAILGFDVEWAAPGGVDDLIDPALYADFAAHAAAHFADEIDYYEIWNEQNIPRFWQPLPNPLKFGELMKASYEAIHDNDEVATVIFGGLSPLNRQLFEPAGIWSFLVQVFDEHPDICESFDAMSIHPYTFFQQTSPELPVDLGLFRYPTLVESIDQVRGILDVIGCPDKSIHLTDRDGLAGHLYRPRTAGGLSGAGGNAGRLAADRLLRLVHLLGRQRRRCAADRGRLRPLHLVRRRPAAQAVLIHGLGAVYASGRLALRRQPGRGA